MSGATLPPLITHTTVEPAAGEALPDSRAARLAPPEGSAASLARWIRTEAIDDLTVRHSHHLVHEVPDVAERVFSGKWRRQAVSDRIHSFEVDWSPSLQAPTHRVRPVGLYAYDADGWPLKLHGHGDTRDEPATSDRNHNHVRVWHLLEEPRGPPSPGRP